MQAVASFRNMLKEVPRRLAELSPENVAHRPSPNDWSVRQELGHLLDSAVVNHGRLMRVLTEGNPTLPSYDGVYWEAAHQYHDRDWADLIATWQRLNAHFLWAIERLTEDQWRRPCVSEGKSVTLEFLVTDYVHHGLHHLQHMGIYIGDLGQSQSATA